MVIRQLLIVTLLWPLMCASGEAQQSNAFPDATAAGGFHLKGVLVSQSGRSALVNSTVAREGDRVGGAKILTIAEGEVRILMGSREIVMRVGSTADHASQPAIRLSSSKQHTVKRGETLSGISQRYLSNGATLNQMMIALFAANPRAFNGNINILHAGSVLRIPDVDELHRQSRESAMAQVMRHEDEWRTGNQQRTVVAMESSRRHYGPVSSGETLSGIATRVLREGVTLNQMMIALYRANPEAFSGNIDVLHEGAILRVPDEYEISARGPDLATAFNPMTAPLHETTYPTVSCRLTYPTLRPDRRSHRLAKSGMPPPC